MISKRYFYWLLFLLLIFRLIHNKEINYSNYVDQTEMYVGNLLLKTCCSIPSGFTTFFHVYVMIHVSPLLLWWMNILPHYPEGQIRVPSQHHWIFQYNSFNTKSTHHHNPQISPHGLTGVTYSAKRTCSWAGLF